MTILLFSGTDPIVFLVWNMEAELDIIARWLKDSGLRDSKSKPEVCLFHRMDCQSVALNVSNSPIKS
jgi:hypothetical protein